jgi:uncharacterized protein (DUF433 family)/DNA-binding transcriptional MerR regulator
VSDTPRIPIKTGIYSLSDAAKLTGVSIWRIRRWLKGYDYRGRKSIKHSNALWQGQLKPVENRTALGFMDLMEVRFVEAFLKRGVSWKTMRRAHERARQEFGMEHPFCTNRFVTDGRRILLQDATEAFDQALIDIAENQREFLKIVEPFFKELEFTDKRMLSRWWPLGKNRNVVVDPVRNFGQPTSAKSGVPTHILARSLAANKSIDVVARWFEVQPDEVRDADEFEQRLAA